MATLPDRGSGSIQASGLTADDVTVTNNGGNLSTLTIDPSIDVTWSNISEPVSNVQLNITVTNPASDNSAQVVSNGKSTSGTSGSVTISLGEKSLLSSGNGPLNAANFEPSSDGGTKQTDVEVTVEVILQDSSSGTIKSTSKTSTFTVTVQAESMTVSGSLGTGAT